MRHWPKNATLSLGMLLIGAIAPAQVGAVAVQSDNEMTAVLSMMQLSDAESKILTIKKEIAANPQNGDHWARLGQAYLLLKDYGQAEQAFHQARQRRLSARRWALPLGKIYLARKKYVELLDELPEPQDWLPEDEWVQSVLILRADAFRHLEMYQRAANLYQSVIDADSTNGQALFGLARAQFSMGYPEQTLLSTLQAAKAAGYQDIDNLAEFVALMTRRSGNWQLLEKANQDLIAGERPDPLSLMTMTYAALFQGHLGEFFHYADRLYQVMPHNPKVQYLYALSRYHVDNKDQAEDVLATAIDADPTNVLPYFLLAKIYYENQNLPLAATTLSKLHRFMPDNINATFFLSVVLLQLNEADRALPLIQQQIEKRPSDYRLYGLMGNTMLQRQDWTAAIDYYNVAAQHYVLTKSAPLVVDFSEDEDALAAYLDLNNVVTINDSLMRIDAIRAINALQNFDFVSAENYAAKNLLIKQDPVANYLYGQVLAQMEQYEKAESYLEMANIDAPTFKANTKLLAKVYLHTGQSDTAQSLVSKMLQVDPKDSALLVLQASIADKRNESQNTIQWLNSAIENAPDSPDPRLALVAYYLKIGEDAQALTLAKDSYTYFPKEIQFLNTMAKVALKLEDWDTAVQANLALEDRLPGSSMVLLNLAKAYNGKQDNKACVATLDRILAQDPNDLSALLFKAQLLSSSQDNDGIKSVAEKILAIKPEHPAGLSLLAQASASDGQWHEAVRFYDKAFASGPTAQLAIARFDSRKEIDQLSEGFEILQDWIKKHPEDLSTRRYMAEQYEALAYAYEAILAWERFLLDAPEDVPALMSLAQLYGKYDTRRAMDFAARAQQLSPDNPQVQDTMGWILVLDGNTKRGFHLLDKAAKADPKNALVRYHLGVAKQKLGDINGAKEDLAYVIRQNMLPSVQEEAVALLRSLDFEEHYDAGIRL